MKRTVEVVLAVIGAFVYLVGALIGGFIRMIEGNDAILEEILLEDPSISPSDVQLILDGIGSIGTILVVGSIIAIIAGIVAMILFKGNNKPVVAGIILLVVGGGTTLLTFGAGIFAGIFYIIAGIMGLVRKPKQEVNMEQY